jgi:hypothetical protein
MLFLSVLNSPRYNHYILAMFASKEQKLVHHSHDNREYILIFQLNVLIVLLNLMVDDHIQFLYRYFYEDQLKFE